MLDEAYTTMWKHWMSEAGKEEALQMSKIRKLSKVKLSSVGSIPGSTSPRNDQVSEIYKPKNPCSYQMFSVPFLMVHGMV